MTEKILQEFEKSSHSFLRNTAALDHYMTLLIFVHLFGKDSIKENNPLVEDFTKWFLISPQHKISFGRKKTIFCDIFGKQEYTKYRDRYKNHLSKATLTKLIDHRNLLAHSFYLKTKQTKSYIIESVWVTESSMKNSFKIDIDIAEHNKLLTQSTRTMKALHDLMIDLGVLDASDK